MHHCTQCEWALRQRTLRPCACEENASLYAVWMGFTAPYIAVHWCKWIYVHPSAECVDVRRCTQGWRKQRKVQNMPLIWRISYHATNSSHVTNHFSSTLLSLRYMCCVACWWKSRLTPAVLCWKARPRDAAASCHVVTGRCRFARRTARSAAYSG